MIDSLLDFLQRARAFLAEHPGPWLAGGIASLVLGVGSLATVPWAIRRLPADHFIGPVAPGASETRLVRRVLRNVAGFVLVTVGVAMLALPGQGLVTIVLGLVLVDFPGKRRFEQALVRRRGIRRGLDWMRKRGGRAPFEVPGLDDGRHGGSKDDLDEGSGGDSDGDAGSR